MRPLEERARADLITRRSQTRSSFHRCANMQGNHPLPFVSGSLASQASSAASCHGSCMQMWPSPRLLWSPPCCMCSRLGAEPSGVRTHWQRGCGSSEEERICSRFGCAGCQHCGLPLFSSRHHVGRRRQMGCSRRSPKVWALNENTTFADACSAGWRMRLFWLLGCAAMKAVVASLLKVQRCVGIDGTSPTGHEVECDFLDAVFAAWASVTQIFCNRSLHSGSKKAFVKIFGKCFIFETRQ